VTIAGYPQPGASPNTLVGSNDAVILIELNGTNAGDEASGLTITGGGSTIRGLAINRFDASGIRLESSDNMVEGNLFGTDVTGTLALGNGEGVTLVGANENEINPLYSNDFESSVGEEWSTGRTDVTPVGNRRFLGQFGNETATLRLNADDIDQDHTTAITVEFDLFVLRTWDGNHTGSGSGPDRWSLTLGNGMSLLDTTFSNNVPNSSFAGQAYPGVFGSGQFDPRTGAEENNTLGFLFGNDEFDAVYHLSFTFSYTGGDVVLKFAGGLTTPGDDESWGLDNVEVRAIASADTAPNNYSLASNPNGVWTYGWTSTLGGTLHPYPSSFTSSGLQTWIDNSIASLGAPATAYNATAAATGGCCTVQPGQLTFHPGPNGEQSVVRWTAPADDTVKVAAFFVGIDGSPTTTDAHVLHNGVSLFDGVVNRLYAGPYYETTLDVKAGDNIDFVVGTGGNGFFSDSSALDAVITTGVSHGPAAGNVIGGTSPGNQNIIAYSGGDGIRMTSENASAAIVGNSIVANRASGIDLAGDGLPVPVILTTSFPGELRIDGSLDAETSTKYRIEFFASDAADPSGFGEGQRLLGVRGVTTDPSGHIAFIHELPPVADGQWITATATRLDGDGETLLETSEFSAAVQVLADAAANADLEITIIDSPDPVFLGDSVTYTVGVTNHGPANATGVIVVALGPPGQQFNSVTIPVGGLSSGASSSFQLSFTPTVLGTFSASASVYATEDDPNPSNNSFTETTQVKSGVTFELTQAQYEVREGEEFAVLTVRRTGSLASSASVEFATVNGTAGQRGIGTAFTRVVDFTTTSGELFFRPRSNVATIRIPIGDDGVLEPDETFRVVLSNPSGDADLGPVSSAQVVIHDNDPTLSFVATSSERNEGQTGRITIEVRLQPPSNKPVTVVYTADGGSATAGTDYTLTGSRTLTFRPGETRKFINFNTINDTLFEANETAFIELSSPTNAFLGGTPRHRVTILDNDPKPPPVDPGSSAATALAIDLATLPRQVYRQYIGKGDVDTFKVTLGPLERLALDVDPSTLASGLPSLPSSKLKILGDNGAVLATIGASAEPDTGQLTNNAAHLFQADADGGTYYVQLSTTATGKAYGYSLAFHRIGVSERVPSPEQLNVSGPMHAWYNGSDTVGITGPTGYGFTLTGPWHQTAMFSRRTGLISQTLTLNTGSQFTLASPQGVELPLVANGTITISTKSQRWGDVFGVVATDAIRFPVALSIVPINNLLADAFGSSFATVGLLGGEWRISLGGSIYNILGAAIDAKENIDQLLPGVPYIRKFGGATVDARLGGQRLSFSETPMNWVFDPADPMLFVKVPEVPFTNFKGAALAISMHGLLKFKPQDAPDPAIDAGVTEFAGHVYARAKFTFFVGPVPVTVDGDIVINVDADRDGLLLGDLRDVDDVLDILKGDFSELREILNDIQLGANGTAVVAVPRKKPEGQDGPEIEAGRASVVLNGLEETVWLRGQQGGQAFPDSPIEVAGSSIVMEGLLNFSGDFFIALTTSYNAGGVELAYKFTVSNEGITANITGSIAWDVKIDYLAGTVSGKAKATITAQISIEIDDDGDVHLSGSVSARGRLTAKINGNTKELFDDSIDASVRSHGFRFKFPRGVGHLDFDLF